MRNLFPFMKNYRTQIILGPFFKFLEAVFELILPLLMAGLVDQGITQNNRQLIWVMTGWMVFFSITGLLCALICQYYASIASQGFGTEIRNQLMKKINQLSHTQLNTLGTDTLITRMTNDVNQLQVALAMVIRLLVRAPFLSVGSVVMAFIIDWHAGVIFLLTLPIFCFVLYWIITKTVPLYQKVQGKLDQINALVTQNLSGVRVIRAFTRTKTETKHFNAATDDLARTYTRVTNLSALLSPATTLILNLGVIALFTVGGVKVNLGELQQGEVLALVNYMNQMLLALIVVSNLVVLFTRAHASSLRVNEVLAMTTNSEETTTTPQPLTSGNIRFEAVAFRFAPEYGLALHNLSFAVQSGTTLGVIGATGSGKTALTQLIPRFYETTSGRVLVDGQNVNEWPLATLREAIGIVPQKAVLFSGTIRENLQWGKKEADDSEIWYALWLAQIDDFVRSLPQELDTPVFEGGKNFSGGQRQRLTIARALIRRPKILILDDSLSALDYQTDLNLRKTLAKIPNLTLIIISQRVRSLQEADQILVLADGKMNGLGTHQELLVTSTLYQELVTSQKEEQHASQ
ncbi:MAG: ABC transporter ATP-binding protein [Enterococcus sp.]